MTDLLLLGWLEHHAHHKCKQSTIELITGTDQTQILLQDSTVPHYLGRYRG